MPVVRVLFTGIMVAATVLLAIWLLTVIGPLIPAAIPLFIGIGIVYAMIIAYERFAK